MVDEVAHVALSPPIGMEDKMRWLCRRLEGLPAGALAYRRDNPDAETHLLDAGHFALETHRQDIGALMRGFLERRLSAG